MAVRLEQWLADSLARSMALCESHHMCLSRTAICKHPQEQVLMLLRPVTHERTAPSDAKIFGSPPRKILLCSIARQCKFVAASIDGSTSAFVAASSDNCISQPTKEITNCSCRQYHDNHALCVAASNYQHLRLSKILLIAAASDDIKIFDVAREL